jgi:peptidyl-prolyl cis-trans isomerase B (cyclophilin B)
MSAANTKNLSDIRIVMKTNKGDIALTVFASKTPVTAASFLNLAKNKFYDGVTFHRVIAGFMMQGGDPTGTGMGGPGYQFEDEFRPDLRFDRAGLLAMANAGPRTNGSQFFITYGPTPHLDDHHTIFGEATAGLDVTTQIGRGDKIASIDILDPIDNLLAAHADRVAEWDKKSASAKR